MTESKAADMKKPQTTSVDQRTPTECSSMVNNVHNEVAQESGIRMTASPFLRALMLIVFTCAFSTALFAQNATFTGRVTDSSGAVVTKAKIIVHNLATGVDTTTITTKSGDYTVPYLISGHYSVSAEAAGFKRENRTDVELQTAQVGTVNFALQVGAVTESVNVRDNDLLDRGKADRGEVTENALVTEMPLNGRNPVMLAQQDSAVIYDGVFQYTRPFDGQTYTNMHVNGSDPGGGANYSTEVLLDGADNQTPRPENVGHTDVAYVAPEDSVQEFKIVTNPYDSQYGRNRGGVIDMTLKSGTNRLHGDVYESARRTWLDANLWINDYIIATQPKLASNFETLNHKLDQYGLELDGPIVLPKLFNGRNQAFFLMQVENWNEIDPATLTTSVPDPQWATGNFSGLIYNNLPVTIYNPYSTYTDSSGNLARNAFPNNKIPQSMINPTAQTILSYYPAPNAVGPNGTPWQNNYYAQKPSVDTYRNALIKLDWNISPEDRFSIRYGYWERYETVTNNGIPGAGAYGEEPLGDRSHTFGTQWTHTFTPNLLFDFHSSVVVKAQIGLVTPPGFNATTILGWPSSLTSQMGGFSLFPGMSPSGFTGLGDTGAANSLTTTDAIDNLPTVTWIKGKHALHMGIDWRLYQYAVPVNAATEGNIAFNQLWTQNCWSCSSGSDYAGLSDNNSEGNSIASMLLGTGSSGSQSIAPTAFYTSSYYAPFLQDDWKVTPRLTLNLGLRYDYQPYHVERHNREDYSFNTTTANPVMSQLPSTTLSTGLNFNLVGGITFAGVNGNPRHLYPTNKLELQPRVGFVYSATNKILVRGGFGEMFQNSDAFPLQTGFSATTSYVNSLDGGLTPIDNLSDPYPSILQPSGSSNGLLTALGNGETYTNPNFKIPNVWTYSLGIEQQFGNNNSMEISYVGTQGPHNETSQNINHWNGNQEVVCDIQLGGNRHICDDIYGPGSTTTSNHNAIYGQVTNPFKGVAPFLGSGDYTANTIGGLGFTEPMPQFGGVTERQWNGSHSWFNSLQVTAQHRYSNNLDLHVGWTWSKMMDAGGWADNNYLIPSRHIDGADRTHNITITGLYKLPVGRGRAILGNTYRIVDALLGGWELGALTRIQTGTPFSFTGWDYVHNAKLPHSYWVKPGARFGGIGNLQVFAPCYYDTNSETGAITPTSEATAFGCTQPDFIKIPSYGEQPNIIYSGIRQPRGFWMDSNLAKTFQITPVRVKLQLRLEGFNILNHPLWQNGYYGDGQYAGELGAATGSGQSNKPREIQIAAKILW